MVKAVLLLAVLTSCAMPIADGVLGTRPTYLVTPSRDVPNLAALGQRPLRPFRRRADPNDAALDQTSARSHQPELSGSHQICSVKSRDALDKSVHLQQARWIAQGIGPPLSIDCLDR